MSTALAPRILTLTGAAYPKARIVTVDAARGVATFSWLDAGGNALDSGGSVARFTPLAPNQAVRGEPVSYPDVDDATLKAAIENPVAPPLEVPPRVLRSQLLLAVFRLHSITETDILDALAAIPDAAAKYEAQVRFNHAAEYHRSHPLVLQLAAAFNLNSAQVDAVFQLAATLQ